VNYKWHAFKIRQKDPFCTVVSGDIAKVKCDKDVKLHEFCGRET